MSQGRSKGKSPEPDVPPHVANEHGQADQPTGTKRPSWPILNDDDVEPHVANEHGQADQPTGTKRPSWPILNDDDVEPKVNKKAATEHNRDAQSQNVVPAGQGGQDPSSSRPTQDLEAAYAADADDRAKKFFGKDVSAERQAQTTVGQATMPHTGSVKLKISSGSQLPPNTEEKAILKEKQAELAALIEHGKNWDEIGPILGVRSVAAKFEWRQNLEKDHPETSALRRSWMQRRSQLEKRDAKARGSSRK